MIEKVAEWRERQDSVWKNNNHVTKKHSTMQTYTVQGQQIQRERERKGACKRNFTVQMGRQHYRLIIKREKEGVHAELLQLCECTACSSLVHKFFTNYS